MATKFRQGWLDHSGEQSFTQFYIQEAAGDDLTTAIATAAIVATALEVISLCTALDRTASIEVASNPSVLPASPYAQRESALKVFYQDVVTSKKFSLTVPGLDQTLLAQAGTDTIDMVANVPAAALKAALEAALCSESGNAIVVTRMRFVGRAS